jgi:hypothetical protein
MVVPHINIENGFLIDIFYSGSDWVAPLAWKDHPLIIQDPFIPTMVRLTLLFEALTLT